MATIKFNKSFFRRTRRKIENIAKPMNRETKDRIGTTVVDEMKRQIASGISPIRGKGRFPKYKNAKKYPGKRKPQRPVNLKLTGDFLDDLDYKRTRDGVEVGYFTGSEALKEQGHREGANKQRKRPTIPIVDKGEQYSVRIVNKVLDILNARVNKLTKS